MSAPTVAERLHIARLCGDAAASSLASRLAGLPLLGWRTLRPRADELLFVPSDMRPADPGLADEIAAGQMGLGGAVLDLAGSSPFAVVAPDRAWARELNGFAWLGGLRTAGGKDVADLARSLVADWCRRNRRMPGGRGLAAEPMVMARRVTAWIVGAGFLLEGADAAFYRLFARALGGELRALDLASRRAPPGFARLAAHNAILLACLALAGHDRHLARVERRLLDELAAQIVADGGHISRNPAIVLDIALDLLPIRQCYAARGLAIPAAIDSTVERMLGHLRTMSTHAGALARFNGIGADRSDALATALALQVGASPIASRSPGPSGYARLERGGTTLIVDCGRPPPLVHSGLAHAGCLSFEMAHGGESIVVNAGAPLPGYGRLNADARATASHSTLTLDDQSSARLVRSACLERIVGAPALAGPDLVAASLVEANGETRLVAYHDGYLARFGLLHERRITLSEDGRSVSGEDVLRPHAGTLRLPHDVPLAVRFHLPVDIASTTERDGAIILARPSGNAWRLTAGGGRLALEAATDYAQSLGPVPARQAVIRTATPGETIVSWKLERL